MKDNISSINSEEVSKLSKNQNAPVNKENSIAKNGGANDQVVVIHLSDYAKHTCQTMRKPTFNDQANTDEPGLTESISPGFRVINEDLLDCF